MPAKRLHECNYAKLHWIYTRSGSVTPATPVLVTENDVGPQLHNGDVGVVVRHAQPPDKRAVVFPTQQGGLSDLEPESTATLRAGVCHVHSQEPGAPDSAEGARRGPRRRPAGGARPSRSCMD
jgi:hypothetical protein